MQTEGKPYSLKIIHKPSNAVNQERWFNTEDERKAAMRGIKLHENYTSRTDDVLVPRVAKAGANTSPDLGRVANISLGRRTRRYNDP